MANRYAKPVRVRQLKQKLELLYQSGHVDGDAALGRLFRSQAAPKGITGKAIRLWVYGDGSRPPNMIPADRFNRFIEILQQRLPGNRRIDETRALLLSPNASDLAAAFMASVPKADWISLVLKAQLGGITIVLWDPSDVFTVTARRRVLEGLNGSVKCPLNHHFRFKLDSVNPGWVTALQWGQSGWFGLELDDELVSLEQSEHGGMFPLRPPYYIENDPGVRRYVFITTPVPLPPDLLAKVKTSTRGNVPLDVSTLDRFAYVGDEMPDFHINVLDVQFTDSKTARG